MKSLDWEDDFSLKALLHGLRVVLLRELAEHVVFLSRGVARENQSCVQFVSDGGGAHTFTKVAAAIL